MIAAVALLLAVQIYRCALLFRCLTRRPSRFYYEVFIHVSEDENAIFNPVVARIDLLCSVQ
jgi:hypothetical protein